MLAAILRASSRVGSAPSLRLQGVYVYVANERDDPAAHVRFQVFGVDTKSSGQIDLILISPYRHFARSVSRHHFPTINDPVKSVKRKYAPMVF